MRAAPGGDAMIHPIPPGTRDVLPDEMRELRALSTCILETWQRAGYGEVWTPTLEYEDVMRRGAVRHAARRPGGARVRARGAARNPRAARPGRGGEPHPRPRPRQGGARRARPSAHAERRPRGARPRERPGEPRRRRPARAVRA